MTKAIFLILFIFFMASNKLFHGKNLQRRVKEIKPIEISTLRASRLVWGGIHTKKNKGWQTEGTKTVNRIYDNIKESEGRNRKKRFINWHRSIIRGLKLKRKLKAKNFKDCTVFLAYTLSNKCKILRIRLK